ncbi:MAG: DNA repair protein RadC [Acidobacteriota bacterium]|nr:MAG: DNA repair protein RadC [Acidobacteriota bacterium]
MRRRRDQNGECPQLARPRVREKLTRSGSARLEVWELIALLLGNGITGRPVTELATDLLQRHGGLDGLARASCEILESQRGVGAVGAARLVAAFELARRLSSSFDPRPRVRSPDDVAREVADLVHARREQMVGLYLNAHSRLLARETIAVGSLNVARAVPRDVFEPAIRLLAASIVLAHNHPSGVPEPSEDDLRFTQVIGQTAVLIGVPLLDHVIVSRAGVVSLRARGVAWDGQPEPGRLAEPTAGAYGPSPEAAREGPAGPRLVQAGILPSCCTN